MTTPSLQEGLDTLTALFKLQNEETGVLALDPLQVKHMQSALCSLLHFAFEDRPLHSFQARSASNLLHQFDESPSALQSLINFWNTPTGESDDDDDGQQRCTSASSGWAHHRDDDDDVQCITQCVSVPPVYESLEEEDDDDDDDDDLHRKRKRRKVRHI
jgi:hypothetical protein